jgi:alanyl-tRNA synthetase
LTASEFKGYDHLELNGKVTALFVDGKAVDSISAGQEAVVILDKRRSMRNPAARWAIKAN